MSNEKLSELSKPVAWTWNAYGMQHVTTEADESAELILDGVDVNPLYSQEYVSALLAELEAKDKRIVELERSNQSQDDHINQQQDRIDSLEKKNSDLGRALGAAEKNLVYSSDAIATWERKAISNFEECATMSQRIEELEKRLATPVQLQSPWEDNVGNRWLLEGTTADAIRAAGFTVEGDE